jgi:uncharacterized membrane protein YgdD (TMEM256/DUF423 family)
MLHPFLSDPDIRAVQTAIFFALFHGIALLVVPKGADLSANQSKIISLLWMLGIIGFSVSIFLLKLGIAHSWDAMKIIGPITPFGGGLLILSWLYLFFILLKRNSSTN